MNKTNIYKVLPHIINKYKYKSPVKIMIPIKTVNSIFEKKNIDINDVDYSDKFWKKIKK